MVTIANSKVNTKIYKYRFSSKCMLQMSHVLFWFWLLSTLIFFWYVIAFILVLECPYPNVPGNASMTITGLYFNDNVSYTCDDGFKLYSGDLFRTCGRTRKWSGFVPTCIGESVIELYIVLLFTQNYIKWKDTC